MVYRLHAVFSWALWTPLIIIIIIIIVVVVYPETSLV